MAALKVFSKRRHFFSERHDICEKRIYFCKKEPRMKTFLSFLLLVLTHHFLLAPLIRKRLPLYIGLTVALLVAFGFWCLSPQSIPAGQPPEFRSGMAPPPPRESGIGGSQGRKIPRPMRPEVMRLVMGVLLVGVDLGAYFYVESRRKERKMKELQAENLSQQLESLKYQINPHFFMNTLNNIHALVDIDPEKAKESIEVFSKMMRILLYENESPTIPLSKELDFIEHFISLMRLRYPEDTVKIETIFPEDRSGAVVPPLVMASFVENSFKHGVSYSADSFIRIKVEMQEGKVVFRCSNSTLKSDSSSGQGIGLDNIRKRLELLYGQSYTLSIDDTAGQYDVFLAIPAKPETSQL